MCLIYKELLKIKGKNKETTGKIGRGHRQLKKIHKNALNIDLDIT